MGKSLVFVIAVLNGLCAHADQPLSAPEVLTFCSRSRDFCAVSDPGKWETRILPQQPGKQSWSIVGWHRWVFVADGGECVVIGHEGMNLLPRGATLDERVLYFYCQGQLVREVILGELYENIADLAMTASHLAWVESISFNRENQLIVELVGGKRVAFSFRGLIEEFGENDT